ncbi:MAG: 4'-phosphopantetheinyl transferase superfamily protein [Pseudomonadota bacterium]
MLAERQRLLSELFDSAVATVASDLSNDSVQVFPEEEALMLDAAEARRLEFRTGRACAHAALRALGLQPTPVLRGARREPLWPGGIVGSITHTAGFCAAAVAQTQDYRALGLDAELDARASADFVRRVCSAREIARCAELGPIEYLANVVFSAKEAIHKLQYPLSCQVLYWRDLEVQLDPPHTGAGTFQAQFLNPSPPFAPGALLAGRWRRGGGLILTGAVLAPAA